MKGISTLALSIAVVGASLVASPHSASAQLHNVDVILSIANNRVQTGFVDPQDQQQVIEQRVYPVTLGNFDSTSNPGFDSAPGSLPPDSTVGFDILAPLAIWDGSQFWTDPAAPGYPPSLPNPLPRIRMRLGPLMVYSALPADPDPFVPGIGFAVDSDGVYHHHFTYTLFSQANPPAVPAESGIYMLPLQIWCTRPGIQTSEPIYMVINQQADPADQQAAIDFLNRQLSPPACPADFNGDGILNADDLGDFITAYFNSPPDPLADFNGDGVINADDLGDFITAYFNGC